MDCLRVTLRRAAGSYFIFRLVLMNIFDELNNQTQSSVDNNSHEKQQVGDDLDFIFFGRERERKTGQISEYGIPLRLLTLIQTYRSSLCVKCGLVFQFTVRILPGDQRPPVPPRR